MKDRKLLCRQVQEYIDGLSQRQFREETEGGLMYDHIRQCPECREYFSRAKSLSERLDEWKVPDSKRNITAGVMTQIAQLESDGKRRRFGLWNRLPALAAYRIRVPAGVAAAVFIILAVSIFLNITGPGIYRDSEGLTADKKILQGVEFSHTGRQKPYPVTVRPDAIEAQYDGREGIYFFGASPEIAPTSLVIILGAPGIISVETAPQPEKISLINQSL
jgi:hypothetical protein